MDKIKNAANHLFHKDKAANAGDAANPSATNPGSGGASSYLNKGVDYAQDQSYLPNSGTQQGQYIDKAQQQFSKYAGGGSGSAGGAGAGVGAGAGAVGTGAGGLGTSAGGLSTGAGGMGTGAGADTTMSGPGVDSGNANSGFASSGPTSYADRGADYAQQNNPLPDSDPTQGQYLDRAQQAYSSYAGGGNTNAGNF